MKLDKNFLSTEFGAELENCIRTWDNALTELRKVTPGFSVNTDEGLGYEYWNNTCKWCQAQWEVYQLAMRNFFKKDYHFTRTDDYFGVVTEDGTDWLLKVERKEV